MSERPDALRRESDERALVAVVRGVLWTFVGLTGAIALIGLVDGSYNRALLSLGGASVYGLLLVGLGRLGARRAGILCTAWYLLLATGAMATGRGIHDITITLFPAGILLGAILLERRHLLTLTLATVFLASAVGILQVVRPGEWGPLDRARVADVAVMALLLLVGGVLANVVVGSLQNRIAEREKAEEDARRSMSLLEATLESRKRSERREQAAYRISESAQEASSLEDLFRAIHAIVSELMPARNFYIALHEPGRRGVLSFPYFVDEADEPFPPKPLGKGLTEYVLRTGRPLLASPAVFEELVASGEVEQIGSSSLDWLGVPLHGRDRIIGVLAVQSYSGEVRYTEDDQDLLVFVSSQIAQAVERKRSEEILRANELRLRTIVAALPDLVLVLDRNGRYLEIHATRLDNLILPRETLLGRTIPEFLPSPAAALWMEKIGACLLTGEAQMLEYALDVLAGPRAFEARIVPYGADSVLTIVRDVTERAQALEALSSAQSDLKRVTDNMVDVISQLDLEGRFQFVSPSHEIVTGWTFDELLGANALDLVHPDDREALRARLARAAQTGKSGSAEYRYRLRDGRYSWVETVSKVLRGPDGNAQGFVLGSRDVTARKRAEAVLGVLHETERKILRHEPIERILQFICDEVAGRFEFAVVWIGSKESDGSISPRAVAGPVGNFVRQSRFRWDGAPEGKGPSGEAIRSGRPVTVETKADERVAAWQEGVRKYHLGSALSIPLVVGDTVLGVLSSYSERPEDYGAETARLLGRFADQAALALVEAEQHERIELQTAALEAAANAVLITDREGRIEWVNPAFTSLTGWKREEVIGDTPRLLKSDKERPYFYKKLWETILAGNVWRGELQNRRKDGTLYMEEQTITPVRSADGEIRHFVSIKQDITARRKDEERIRHLALHDPLTDLANRHAFEESLARIVSRARRGSHSSLLLVDLDNFKIVNDALGHPAGDRVLVELARLIVALVRPGDEVARFGGDEFAVLLEGVALEEARITAERLRRAVDEHRFVVGDRVFDLGVSVGVVPVDGSTDAAALMALADTALYTAKEKGRNRVAVIESTAGGASLLSEASRWASRIKESLRENRFVLHYQPIVHFGTGRVAHFEALVRLREGPEDLIAPDVFLPAAERFGLMPSIDGWVVEHVIERLVRSPGVEIFVNLSGTSLGHESLLARIEERVTAAGLPAGCLAFEITETAAVKDIVVAREWMRRLKVLGCRFALDDFGIGFSSFSYLQSLPADYVKIDGSFIRGVETDPAARALVRAIDTVARTLGKETIAECVENLESVKTLVELGVGYGQGFALGRPAPEISPRGGVNPGKT
jgi:diguanylate cyclase (GGDEF)-like protein/PAS domain S-box-containing protein